MTIVELAAEFAARTFTSIIPLITRCATVYLLTFVRLDSRRDRGESNTVGSGGQWKVCYKTRRCPRLTRHAPLTQERG